MTRYAKRTDGNHQEIREALRQAGYSVIDYSRAGMGIPDLCAMRGAFRCWVEVKMPGEGLTDAEHRFFESAPGCKIVATTPEDAVEQLQALWKMDGAR